MTLTEFAPAKVNLFLHVGQAREDGRHPICSLVAFADVGDVLTATPSEAFDLVVSGPFAPDVGPGEDNLITRALTLVDGPGMSVHLLKALPVASGLGGGTSDAGAALRLLQRVDGGIDAERLEEAARAIGADGLMCLRARSCLAEGEGERLSEAPRLPPLPTVLINPGVASPTGDVYRAYDAGRGAFRADRPQMPKAFSSVAEVAAFLAAQRNDLEVPAMARTPLIEEALNALKRQDGARLARMSGSGATTFGLFDDDAAAAAAARHLADAHPSWWVQACRLG